MKNNVGIDKNRHQGSLVVSMISPLDSLFFQRPLIVLRPASHFAPQLPKAMFIKIFGRSRGADSWSAQQIQERTNRLANEWVNCFFLSD
jgi:hypothetical protein